MLRNFVSGSSVCLVGAATAAAMTLTTFTSRVSVAQHPELTPAGVFTAIATEAAFTTNAGSSGSFIESGGGFLWFDATGTGGPAIGFDHFLFAPEGTNRAADAGGFFAQQGIPTFPNPDGGTMVFSRWENDPPTPDKPEETVRIFGDLFVDGEIQGEISLSGFIFSDEPVGRDLIPEFTFDLLPPGDAAVDHVEFVDSNWDGQVVNDVANFLVLQGVLDVTQAGQITAQFVPEPFAGILALVGLAVVGLWMRQRRQSKPIDSL